MKLNVDNTLVHAAREIGPLIYEHAAQTEREGRPAAPVMEALAGAGLLRMYTPRSLGGLETDPVTCTRVIEEISGFDSAAGWALQGNSPRWWCARLPDQGSEELFADDPNAIIAAAFHPPMQAVEVDGGYRVTGRSPLASNIHDATWLLVTALIMEGDQPKVVDGAPRVIGVIARAGEAKIIDTWDALGMRGTDSNDVALHDVVVPSRRTFPLVPEFEPGMHYQAPLYRAPAFAAAVAAIGPPVALAIARGAIEEVRALAQKKTPFGSATTLRERASIQAKLGQAEAILRSARLLLYDTLAAAWERTLAGEPSTLEDKTDLLMASTHAVNSAARATELMYGVAGTSAIYTRSRLERHFRDAHVIKQHGFMSESRYETVGQVAFGLPPDLALVVF